MIETPDILRRLKALIESGGSFTALFDRALISRSRALELVEVLMESLPEELEQANSIIERQDQIIEEAERKAGGIVDDAVIRAEKLVDTDIITREAKARASEIQDDADNYVLGKLEGLEDEIAELLKEVRSGVRALGGASPDSQTDANTLDND